MFKAMILNTIPVCITLLIAGYCCFAQPSLPVRIPSIVDRGNYNGTCPSPGVIEAAKNDVNTHIKHTISNRVNPGLNDRYGPPCSCGGVGGWTRIAYLNMTDPNQQCPSNWTFHNSPVRGCGRKTTVRSCDSVFFRASNRSYSRVCGRANAIQRGSPDAFSGSIRGGHWIDSSYVDGISATHGAAGLRQHIWTFAAALYKQNPSYTTILNCKCTNINYAWSYQTPSFVGNNYFCDTGNPGPGYSLTAYYPGDPLWDGEGCGPTSTCCQFNNPPWFCTTLPHTTSDDLELRLCFAGSSTEEDLSISLVDIYIQ